MKEKKFVDLCNENVKNKFFVVNFSDFERLKLSTIERFDDSGVYLGKFPKNFYDFAKNKTYEDFPVYLTLIIENDMLYLRVLNQDIRIVLSVKESMFKKSKLQDFNMLNVIKNKSIDNNISVEDIINTPISVPLSALKPIDLTNGEGFALLDDCEFTLNEIKEKLEDYNRKATEKVKSEYDYWKKILNSKSLTLK